MKRIVLIALSITLAAGGLGLTACGGHKHKFGEWETVKEATCFENGLRRRTCAADGFSEEEIVYAPGYHTFGPDNKCVRGDYEIKYTLGLAYFENEDGTGYYVGRGSASAKEIVLPAYYSGKPVIGVKADGFANPDGLETAAAKIESVWIPDGVTEIGERAFYGAASLGSVTLPNGLKTIADGAFSGCRSLTEINAPKELAEIGANAFFGCSSLVTPPLGDSLKTVGQFAFGACVSLESANLGNAAETVGHGAFAGCTRLKVASLEGVKAISGEAFLNCAALREVAFPGGLESIGSMAFGYCTSLTTFRFGGSMAEWKAVAKENDWFAGEYDVTELPVFYVHCTDGVLDRNNMQTASPSGD